jgi:ABC-type transport system involved in cytochrome c biogenesis permease subunit
MSRVSIVCFAASYAVALVLELSRLLFRSGIRGAVMIAFAVAGLFAHTAYLFYRTLEFYQRAGTGGSPLSSKQEWYFIAAWLLVVVYLYLTCYHPKVPYGVFLLPLVLGLIAVGTFLADPRPFPREPASKLWGLVHGVAILLATVAVLVAFVAGLMYLGQDRRLKSKAPPPSGLRLPSLERLQQIASRALVIALLMTGLGIVAGIVLNLINWDRSVSFLPWTDPVVVSTLSMFGWLLVTSGIGGVYRPAREGRKVAYLTLASFVFLVIALSSVLCHGTQHGGVRTQGATSSARRCEGAASGGVAAGLRGSSARGGGA